jgi:hypothetical protein
LRPHAVELRVARRLRPSTIVEFKAQMRFLPIAMRMTLVAAPITPAGRYSLLGPLEHLHC